MGINQLTKREQNLRPRTNRRLRPTPKRIPSRSNRRIHISHISQPDRTGLNTRSGIENRRRALAKITQFSMGAIDRANPASNLIPAGMTAEIASNAANLLSDIKPGYMLGAKPRQQAIGHVIGIFAGSLCATPLFFLLFLPPDANGVRSVSTMVSDQFAMPAALQWKGVAELIARGLSALPQSAVIAMSLAAVAAVVFEVLRIRTRERFPVSAVSVGLGVVLPPESCLAMWMGALLFWWMGRKKPAPGTRAHDFWVEGCEPICAGLISGAALVGIGNAIVNVLI